NSYSIRFAPNSTFFCCQMIVHFQFILLTDIVNSCCCKITHMSILTLEKST
ncbi:hypothetical protein L9F63_011376, partial [Diploptera punctata]